MRIFVDGSFCDRKKIAGIGVYSVAFKAGIQYEGLCCSLCAELYAVYHGMLIAKPRDKIVSDCQTVVRSVQTGYRICRHQDICELVFKLKKEKKLTIYWINRRHNTVADELARDARKGECIVWEDRYE